MKTLVLTISIQYGDARQACELLSGGVFPTKEAFLENINQNYSDLSELLFDVYDLTDFIELCNDQAYSFDSYFIGYVTLNDNNLIAENLISKLERLEAEVEEALINAVINSQIESDFVQSKALKIDIFGYTELVFLDDKLRFIDSNGYHYNLDNGDCTLLDLIELLK